MISELASSFKALKAIEFKTHHSASFLDLDTYGHLGTLSYMKHLIDHRFSQIRDVLGWKLSTINGFSVGFFTRKIEQEFLRPIMPDESFEIRSRVFSVETSTCVVEFEILKAGGKLASKGKLHLTCVDKKTGSSTPWPIEIIRPFFEEGA